MNLINWCKAQRDEKRGYYDIDCFRCGDHLGIVMNGWSVSGGIVPHGICWKCFVVGFNKIEELQVKYSHPKEA